MRNTASKGGIEYALVYLTLTCQHILKRLEYNVLRFRESWRHQQRNCHIALGKTCQLSFEQGSQKVYSGSVY